MEIKDWISEKEGELGTLYARMDKDRDIVFLNAYTLKGFKGGPYQDREIPNTVSMTMNRPAVFANAFTMLLQKSELQLEVEGKSDTQNKKVEDYLNDLYYTMDVGLKPYKIASLKAWLCNHVAIRGPIGARFTWDKTGKPSCLPMDMRFCPFETGPTGVSKFAYHTWRSSASIKAEYEKVKGAVLSSIPTGTKIDVYDYWDNEKNVVLANGQTILEVENVYGFPPAVIDFPSTGFMLMDNGYEDKWAESIFFMIRDLIPEWNRLMSIQQTKAIEIIKPRYSHQVKDQTQAPQSYPEIGANTPYNEGEEPHLLQSMDITQGFAGAEKSLDNAIQTGGISESELGNVDLDRTAVWISAQTEIRNKSLIPRLECIESFYRQASEMLIRQYNLLDFEDPIPLGRNSNKKQYKPKELGDPDTYTIDVRFMPDNSQQKIANYSLAISLKGTLSEDTIIRDVIQSDDPDGEIDKKRAEEARQSNPVIFYYDLAERLLDIADTKFADEKQRYIRQAKIMADRMVEEIHKSKQSTQPQQQGTQALQTKQGNANALLTLPSMAKGVK